MGSCEGIVAPPVGERGLKFAGINNKKERTAVAPPVGERGLKSPFQMVRDTRQGRSPCRGAWIEISELPMAIVQALVAPPVGERGLK